MNTVEWKRVKRDKVQEFVDRMNSDPQFFEENQESLLNPCPPEEYSELHDKIRTKFDECVETAKSGGYSSYRSQEYGIDLNMAREIYLVLHDMGFSQRDASDDEIWLYINMYVVPDVIYLRFKRSAKEHLVPDRFYENNRRYYPKMLWWYIHIAWQDVGENWIGCLDATVEMLSGNQSDDISQLIERAGEGGYPTAVYNEVLRRYADELKRGTTVKSLLSKVLHLNIVRMESVEPELVVGGVQSYVSGLFEEVLGTDGRAV